VNDAQYYQVMLGQKRSIEAFFVPDGKPSGEDRSTKRLMPEQEGPSAIQKDALGIPGLVMMTGFISRAEELALLKSIDAEPWSCELSRRVQQYGWRYDYQKRKVTSAMYLGSLPTWCDFALDRLLELGLLPWRPDQLLVNEYIPGQGIAPHVDNEDAFESHVVMLTLGSDIAFEFVTDEATKRFRFVRRMVVVASGDARYRWRHGIRKCKSDVFDGVRVPRGRRVSLTFRKAKAHLTG
jgi:alkylated DNA repair dioxygenase AlkB